MTKGRPALIVLSKGLRVLVIKSNRDRFLAGWCGCGNSVDAQREQQPPWCPYAPCEIVERFHRSLREFFKVAGNELEEHKFGIGASGAIDRRRGRGGSHLVPEFQVDQSVPHALHVPEWFP